jgi:hypothetical protein
VDVWRQHYNIDHIETRFFEPDFAVVTWSAEPIFGHVARFSADFEIFLVPRRTFLVKTESIFAGFLRFWKFIDQIKWKL